MTEKALRALVRELARNLDEALWHIETELMAAGNSQHPTLRRKSAFVQRNRKRLIRVNTKLEER